jgi:tryptophanyl-tRNA synthetase
LKASGKQDAHAALKTDYDTGSLKYKDLKETVAEALVELTQPFKTKLAELNADKKNVKAQIVESSAQIRKMAQQTMQEVREITGLLPLKIANI